MRFSEGLGRAQGSRCVSVPNGQRAWHGVRRKHELGVKSRGVRITSMSRVGRGKRGERAGGPQETFPEECCLVGGGGRGGQRTTRDRITRWAVASTSRSHVVRVARGRDEHRPLLVRGATAVDERTYPHLPRGCVLGPFFLPGPTTTFTNRRLYCRRFFARPVKFLLVFSPLATFGVWPRTLPARASDPWTFPCARKER